MTKAVDLNATEWVLVPRHPTPQMIAAMKRTMSKMPNDRNWVTSDIKHLRRWLAAINAAPKPPEGAISIPHPYKQDRPLVSARTLSALDAPAGQVMRRRG